MKILYKVFLIVFFLLFLSDHIYADNQTKAAKPTLAQKPINMKGVFAGKYVASYQEAAISAELTHVETIVGGHFYMNGVKNNIVANSDGNTLRGKLFNQDENVLYDIKARLKNNSLYLSITFPELNYKVVELVLAKQGVANANQPTSSVRPTAAAPINTRTKDKRLIGTWRYTDVMSSGDLTMVTDTFMQFKPNGEILYWTGSSAGGTRDLHHYDKGGEDISVGGWYTEGKNIVFYDLKTKEEDSIPFFADENRLMLRAGNNRVYERVN